jgi:hypothetical protein
MTSDFVDSAKAATKKRKHFVSSDDEEMAVLSLDAELSDNEGPAMSITDPVTEPSNSEVEDELSAYERYVPLSLCCF